MNKTQRCLEMKCKVIHHSSYMLQKEVDAWLSTGDYDIVSQSQSQYDSVINLVIFYIDRQEKRDRQLEEILDQD